MFSSEAYGQKNLLFKDATSELVPIATQTYEAWLGREYLHAMKGLLCDPNRKSTFLFSCWPQPDSGGGQACWRGGHRRTHTPGGVCASWPQWEPVSSTSLPLMVEEEASLESNGSTVPWKPYLLWGVGSRTPGSVLKGLFAPPPSICQVLSFSLHSGLLLPQCPHPPTVPHSCHNAPILPQCLTPPTMSPFSHNVPILPQCLTPPTMSPFSHSASLLPQCPHPPTMSPFSHSASLLLLTMWPWPWFWHCFSSGPLQ